MEVGDVLTKIYSITLIDVLIHLQPWHGENLLSLVFFYIPVLKLLNHTLIILNFIFIQGLDLESNG